MRLDKLTEKSQEALQAAQKMAESTGHQAIEPEHLLLTLIDQPDGIVR
ncbi:MAG TPA: Clp protease N-terminal domain-containing protein, partial [Candidatus Dormibacteraeota bacterium]|nr:Clp protease N-terminal domain-containing protein [Candidatus Dormibacteraeota bacterium]